MATYKYRTDDEQLTFLRNRIQRLEKTLERLETLGLTQYSSAGSNKSFRQQEEIRVELEKAEQEYEIINARTQGIALNPAFKEMIVCNRRQY
jgi:hypothetical protein